MSLQDPICFGHVVRLAIEAPADAEAQCLGFLQGRGKTETPVLALPPVKNETMDRFSEAEFIIAPIAGEKPQSNGTPLTYKTPFVLRTSDGTKGSSYSLNNKLPRDAVGLALSETKGEMYLEIQRDGFTVESGVYNLDKDLTLKVVDSNRNRKTFNVPLTQVAKPKSDVQGFVACGAGQPLPLRIELVRNDKGELKTETPTYVKNPKPPRRSSTLSALGPQKMEELSRASRINSSEASELDSPSRSSSLAGLSSNPASPRAETEASPSTANPAAQEAASTPLPEEPSEDSSEEAGAPIESPETSSDTSAPVDGLVFGPENRPSAEVEAEGPVFGPKNRTEAELETEGPVFGPMEKPADYQSPSMTKRAPPSSLAPRSPTKKATAASTLTAVPIETSPKQQEAEKLEALKAEAEEDGVDPSCAAKCTVM